MVPVERLLLLELLLGQRHLRVEAVPLQLPPVLQCRMRRGSVTVPEVHGGPPAAPAGAEQQGVHDGAGNELDDARRACLLAPGAAWAGVSGRDAAAVGGSGGH